MWLQAACAGGMPHADAAADTGVLHRQCRVLTGAAPKRCGCHVCRWGRATCRTAQKDCRMLAGIRDYFALALWKPVPADVAVQQT